MNNTHTPMKLFKYCKFGVNALQMITDAKVYYAKPTKFNDPMDCKPTLSNDVDLKTLEALVCKLIDNKEIAVKIIREHRYFSTQFDGNYNKPDTEAYKYYVFYLEKEIKDIIYKEFNDFGVLSLSSKWNSSLMWSHYGDEHHGLCVEYNMTDHDCKKLKKVKYDKNRFIKISDIIDWKIHKSLKAKEKIEDNFFFTKASGWQYEQEWSDINIKNGELSAPAEISAIYFGLRCHNSIITSVIMLYAEQKDKNVKFYKIKEIHNFEIQSYEEDISEIAHFAIREPDYKLVEAFSNLSDN